MLSQWLITLTKADQNGRANCASLAGFSNLTQLLVSFFINKLMHINRLAIVNDLKSKAIELHKLLFKT